MRDARNMLRELHGEEGRSKFGQSYRAGNGKASLAGRDVTKEGVTKRDKGVTRPSRVARRLHLQHRRDDVTP
jgi:hypothetical protein